MSITNSITANNAISPNLQSQISKASTPTTSSDRDKTSADYEDFLLLLTAQLKNQDPLQPLDSTTFVSQLAQFSNVEQQVKMNEKLDGLVSNLTGSDFSEVSNYLGKNVLAQGNKFSIDKNDTETKFNYQTSDNTKSVKAIITDRFNKEIHTINLPLAPNSHTQTWDLKDKDGKKISEGLYNINIQATDDNGDIKKVNTQIKTKILEVQKTKDGFEFLTDTNQKLLLENIKSIYSSQS